MSVRPVPSPVPARFVLPPGAAADAPPERRGLSRDGVRLLVVRDGSIAHRTFTDLPALVDPGDLLVVNTSATLPAAVDAAHPDGRVTPLHISTTLDDGSWVVEVRLADGSGADLAMRRGLMLRLPGELRLHLAAPYPIAASVSRLWTAAPSEPVDPVAYLARHGRPISYGRPATAHPLTDYQTVYAAEPGSAEMASAGRPFSARVVLALVAAGVTIAPLVLHAGVSSPEAHEPPLPERFDVPEDTARMVNSARSAGRRVVAVGTTVVRALESAAGVDGVVRARHGWTDLVLGPARPPRVVSGLITGLHEPAASHMLLLEAVAGRELVGLAYDAALAAGYRWHEFGDSMLFLPD